jgi:hypothetical protein
MLTDEQVDELENYIVRSTTDQLPSLLMRAIPLLFSELRLARAALNDQTNAFFQGGMNNDRPASLDPAGQGKPDPAGIPARRDVGTHVAHEAPPSAEDPDSATAARHGGDEAEGSEVRPKPRRNKRKGKGDSGDLERGGDSPQVGGVSVGVLPIQPRG